MDTEFIIVLSRRTLHRGVSVHVHRVFAPGVFTNLARNMYNVWRSRYAVFDELAASFSRRKTWFRPLKD